MIKPIFIHNIYLIDIYPFLITIHKMTQKKINKNLPMFNKAFKS